MSDQPSRYQRSFAGMVGAMLVLILVIAGFVMFRALNRVEPEAEAQPVDFRGPADYARQQAPFEVLVPRRVAPGWTPTSVRYQPGPEPLWRLGFVTGEDEYVGLVQSTAPVGDLVEQYVDEDAAKGDGLRFGGSTWTTWSDAGGDLAWVREDGDATTLVVTSADDTVLEEFVASLAPA